MRGGGLAATQSDSRELYFEILRSTSGYHARIKDGNHRIIFSTQVYTTKQSAIHACELVKAGAAAAPIYDKT
jgi:uncharacterized protein YegP (UPF0339 family)